MQQSLAVWKNLNKCAESCDALYNTSVNFAYFGTLNDCVNLCACSLHVGSIACRNLNITLFVLFGYCDNSVGSSLDFLDNLSARAYYSTNQILRDYHSFDLWSVVLVGRTWTWQCFKHLAEDVFSTALSLIEGFLEGCVRKSVNLYIHLGCSDTLFGTANLEVHIAKVVFVTENIAQDCIFASLGVGNKSHCNTRNWTGNRNTSVHKSKTASANGSH